MRCPVSLVLLLLLFLSLSDATNTCDSLRSFAKVAMKSFWDTFVNAEEGFFYLWSNKTTPAFYWNSFVALSLLSDARGVGVLDIDHHEAFVASFSQTMSNQGWMSVFFDDMDWAIEALLKTSTLVSNKTLSLELQQVSQLLGKIVQSAWDTTCCGKTPGGFWWDQKKSYKACASNMGTSVAMCSLYEHTNNTQWLLSSWQAFHFWATNFFNSSSGQVADGIVAQSGQVHWDVYTYNQGMTLGSAACLLRHANQLNFSSFSSFFSSSSFSSLQFIQFVSSRVLSFVATDETNGASILHEHSPCGADDTDCAEFKGITARFMTHYGQQVRPAQNNETMLVKKIVGNSVGSIVAGTRNLTSYRLPDHWTTQSNNEGDVYSLSSQTSALAAIVAYLETYC